MASKKASGENIPEGFRNTEAVKLRLDPETNARLRAFAFEHGWSLSETVKQAFEALDRELRAEHEANRLIDEVNAMGKRPMKRTR